MEGIFASAGSICSRGGNWQRLYRHALSQLTCLGRHTITGLASTSGRLFWDWSAEYRLYSRNRFNAQKVFDGIRKKVVEACEAREPLVVGLDDSMLRKTGKKIPGVGYRRDPLGPPFNVNFVRSQRVIQISAAYPCGKGRSRMIPIDFHDAAPAMKPKHYAPSSSWDNYREEQKRLRLSVRGAERLHHLRNWLDENGQSQRALWALVDGGYTNQTVLKQLPQRTTLIGRIRSDAKLHYIPDVSDSLTLGRNRTYGTLAPTPEHLRMDDAVPWKCVRAYAAGKHHDFKVKVIKPLRWRKAGGNQNLQLIVVAPLKYRLRKTTKALYRKPAYIVCTNPDLPVQKVLQAYLWRWDIEVNFRDEKTLLGVGQAQVRHPASINNVPTLAVAAYAALLLAGIRTFGCFGSPDSLPRPKWQSRKPQQRATTTDYIRHLRWELWAKAIRTSHFSHFVNTKKENTKPQKTHPVLHSALFYAMK